jgi:hypothetical protein
MLEIMFRNNYGYQHLNIIYYRQHTIHRGVWIRHEAALFDVQYSSFLLLIIPRLISRDTHAILSRFGSVRSAQLKLWL